MKELMYTRKDRTITYINEAKKKVFISINKAKFESRRLQLAADGALGLGSLKVIR